MPLPWSLHFFVDANSCSVVRYRIQNMGSLWSLGFVPMLIVAEIGYHTCIYQSDRLVALCLSAFPLSAACKHQNFLVRAP